MKINEFIRKNRWPDRLILAIFIFALSVATGNHITDLYIGGLFPYAEGAGAPEIINIYWTSLTILDPMAIAMLVMNVRLGYVVAICIMVTDVPINIYAAANGFPGILPDRNFSGMENTDIPMLIGISTQAAFLVFLLLTVRRVWRLSSL